MSKIDTILTLAYRGFHLFPLLPNSKEPAISGWQDWATMDKSQIEAWHSRNPDHNWGISTSKFGLFDQLCVIDVDNKKGKDGSAELERLDVLYGEIPQTMEAITPTGGRHLFYVTSEPLRNTAGKLAPGLDTRGQGGYVVAAGSTIDGKVYELTNSTAPGILPDWLKNNIGAPTAKSEIRQVVENLDAPTDIRRAISYLAGAPFAVEGAAGDATTYRVAAQLKDLGISEPMASELMLDHWNDHCNPPWPTDELQRKVSNAYSYGTSAIGVRALETAGFDVVEPDPLDPPKFDLDIEEVGDFSEMDLPAYRHVLGDALTKGYVTAVIAAPAVGKSLLTLTAGVAIATGREDLTGFVVADQGAVLVVNNEDDNLDMKKRLKALCRFQGIDASQYMGRLFFKGGARAPIKLATVNAAGVVVATRDVDALKTFIVQRGIKTAIFDPLVEFHGVNENDNAQLGAVVAILRNIAIECDCAVLIVHHTRKPGAADPDAHRGNLDTARGGSSFGGNVRRAFTLFEMSKDEAKKFGIAEAKRFHYMVLDDAKANHSAKSSKARWFYKEGVSLANGDNVVAMRPVRADELKDKMADFGPVVAEEIVAISDEAHECIFSLNDICNRLVMRPLFSDYANANGLAKTQLRDLVKLKLEDGVMVNNYRVACVPKAGSDTGGRPARYVVEVESVSKQA